MLVLLLQLVITETPTKYDATLTVTQNKIYTFAKSTNPNTIICWKDTCKRIEDLFPSNSITIGNNMIFPGRIF